MNYKIILSVFILTLFTIAACSEIEDEITVNETLGVHGEGAKDVNSPNFHGKYLLTFENGSLDNCKQCHGGNFDGGVTEQRCTGCHKPIAIHQDGIKNPGSDNFHAKFMLANSNTLSQCSQCHGDNFKGGVSSPTCANCHNGIPVHVDGIMEPASVNFHGKFLGITSLKLTECSTCHGENFDGGLISPECVTCHKSIDIHKDGISNPSSPNFHAKYLETNDTNLDDCASCHGTDFNGGMSAPSCNSCHSSMGVHQPGMLDPSSPAFHGKYIADNSIQLSACASCHGTDFSGGTSAPGCTSCHNSIGVHQDGIMNGDSPKFHGKFIGANDGVQLSNCATCHGDNFEGGLAAPTCITCHSTITVHKDGVTNPGSENFHAAYLKVENVSITECASCHGADFSGGDSSPSCASCHSSIGVHQEGIQTPSSDKFHGKYLGLNGIGFAPCKTCHGESFEGGTVAPTCLTCHSTIDIHQDGIINPGSDEFHVNYMSENGVKLNTCATCHGNDFAGGSSSPTCTNCHSSIGVHQSGIMNPGSDEFHGNFMGVNEVKLSACATCHGDNFEGGVLAYTCTDCHSTISIHQADIMNPSSEEFHGTAIGTNEFKLTQCATCHGESFEGGLAAPTCATCHSSIDVHKTGITDGSSDNFHGVFLAMNTWELNKCASCHQPDFAGSNTSPTCNDCHTQTSGPKSCNSCHGDFANPSLIAPPNGLRNKADRNQYTGAHLTHLALTTMSAKVECQQCHIIPRTFESEGHVDDGMRSEVVFGNLADPNSSASYDFSNTTCSNTYCHGNFEFKKSDSMYPQFYSGDKMEGNKFNPNWLAVDNGQAQCGTCHGEIDANGQMISALPKGHTGDWDLTQCGTCHQNVMDGSGNFIAPSKHINGRIDVFDE